MGGPGLTEATVEESGTLGYAASYGHETAPCERIAARDECGEVVLAGRLNDALLREPALGEIRVRATTGSVEAAA